MLRAERRKIGEGGRGGQWPPGTRVRRPWAPSAATIRPRMPSVGGRPLETRARPRSISRAGGRRRELGSERARGPLSPSPPRTISQSVARPPQSLYERSGGGPCPAEGRVRPADRG